MPQILDKINMDIERCTRCALCEKRQKVVPGEGAADARLMLVGEGPGQVEDETGRPFAGPAGQLLTQMLGAIGLDRANVYITNIVKCRPPFNREPDPFEANACLPFLREQTKAIKPRIIMCLGKVAASYVISPDIRIMRDHGNIVERKGYLLTATFHPSALLRNPEYKRTAWEDLKKLRKILDEEE